MVVKSKCFELVMLSQEQVKSVINRIMLPRVKHERKDSHNRMMMISIGECNCMWLGMECIMHALYYCKITLYLNTQLQELSLWKRK